MNIFINFVKLIQRDQDKKKRKKTIFTYSFQKKKLKKNLFYLVLLSLACI
jgi:hypothetical protein